jgi:hypothetical protein
VYTCRAASRLVSSNGFVSFGFSSLTAPDLLLWNRRIIQAVRSTLVPFQRPNHTRPASSATVGAYMDFLNSMVAHFLESDRSTRILFVER